MRRLLAAASLAAICALVAVGLQNSSDEGAKGANRPQLGESLPRALRRPFAIPTIRAAQPLQKSNFALLRGTFEPLPASIRRLTRQPQHGMAYGMNWRLAYKVPLPIRGGLWLVPGRGFLCLVAHSGASVSQACTPTKSALRHGIYFAFLPPVGAKWRTVVGVVPDGAPTAQVHTGKATTVVHVQPGGVFMLQDRAAAAPRAITFRRLHRKT